MAAPAAKKRFDAERIRLEIRRARGPFVALIVLALLAIGSTGIILKNIGFRMPWSNTYTTQIAVDDAKGVVPGKQQVKFSGVDIGKIKQVGLKGTQPVIKIAIDGKYGPLYKDARVELRPLTPLNDMYLNIISRGHASAGALGEKDALQADRTKTPVDIGRVLDVFNANTRDRVGQAIDEYGRGLSDHGQQLRQALVALAPFLKAAKTVTQESRVRSAQTRRLVHNFRLMTEELASRDSELRGFVSSGASSLTELGSSERSIQALFGQLPGTLTELRRSFAQVRYTVGHLDPALDALRPTANELPQGLASLRRFSEQAEPSLRELRQPLPNLNTLMAALRPTADRLDSAFTRLSPQVPRLDHITAKVVPCEHPLAKFFQNTLSLSKYYDFHGAIIRGYVVQGSDSAAGASRDPNLSAAPSCVPGGPSHP